MTQPSIAPDVRLDRRDMLAAALGVAGGMLLPGLAH